MRAFSGTIRHARWLLLGLVVLMGCGGDPVTPAPTTQPAAATAITVLLPTATSAPALPSAAPTIVSDVAVQISVPAVPQPISPLIYGMSGAPSDVAQAVRPTLASWGGNPSTRYNWQLGNAWNAARDWGYRNGNYDYHGASASDDFIAQAAKDGAAVRLAVPTLGWVAKNDDQTACSFPLADGTCGDADNADCQHPGITADPTRTSVRSTPDDVIAWIKHLQASNLPVRFVAMDNEPELWGITHYDVHPACSTYDEVRDTYLRYAIAVRAAAPAAELLGPTTCCWYFYWNSAAGGADKAAHSNADFLPWFLDELRAQDQRSGTTTLDVLDIHYYPEGVYNNDVDAATAAHRLRSTRSLWDPSYRDESWIGQPVMLIPRMQQTIAEHYPGRKLGISEWNWGADTTMNGALAIADVLGIYGREGVYLASYWRAPAFQTPGMFAFKLYANYDDQGGQFGGVALGAASSQPDWVSSYAAWDQATGRLQVMLINKNSDRAADVALRLPTTTKPTAAYSYQYDQAAPTTIVRHPHTPGTTIHLPAYSITLLVYETAKL